MPEAPETIEEKQGPANEQSGHEEMHELIHGVDRRPVGRGDFWEQHQIENSHDRVGLE